MAAPRIGRADRLAALTAPDRAIGEPHHLPDRRLTGPASLARLLATPGPSAPPVPPSPAPPAWSAVRERAHQLATALEPLPMALAEIAARINRHCAQTGRDAELRGIVDDVRERIFALSMAVHRLAEAAAAGERR